MLIGSNSILSALAVNREVFRDSRECMSNLGESCGDWTKLRGRRNHVDWLYLLFLFVTIAKLINL